jgi:hypothetical protein
MSYPSQLKLEPKLCELLFLILALCSEEEIMSKTKFASGTIGKYKRQLMWLLCKTTGTHVQQIYHAAKSCPDLVEYLVSQYKDKYPALVSIVLDEKLVTLKKWEHDGLTEAFIWATDIPRPIH